MCITTSLFDVSPTLLSRDDAKEILTRMGNRPPYPHYDGCYRLASRTDFEQCGRGV